MSSYQEKTERDRRRRRINRLKKLILGTIMCMILIPVLCAVFLGVKVVSLNHQIEDLTARLMQYEAQRVQDEVEGSSVPEEGKTVTDQVDAQDQITEAQQDEPLQEQEDDDTVSVYLTFDDGPSSQTNRILDILKEYEVKATFFVVGKTDENSVKAYQRIVEEGHTLGMHSYSHQYGQIYSSQEAFEEDLTMLRDYLFSVTGVESSFYRFPGGSSNKVSAIPMSDLIQCLQDREITYFDWNVSSGDASGAQLSRQTIIDNVMNGINGTGKSYVILFHDSAGKRTTVEALPEIIEQIQAMDNTQLLPITGETQPVQHKIKSKLH